MIVAKHGIIFERVQIKTGVHNYIVLLEAGPALSIKSHVI